MAGKRVHYRERQRLREKDLVDEQSYRLQMRRRHNIALHGWGIVRGLALNLESELVVLTPGLAVDGFGRELIVPQSIEFSDVLLRRLLDQRMGEGQAPLDIYYIDVWLNYRTRTLMPDERSVHLEFFKGTARVCEESWLKLLCANSQQSVDPDHPPGVPTSDLGYPPYRAVVIEADRPWPVYLGRIKITVKETDLDYELPVAGRRFATLVGAGVSSPWKDGLRENGPSDENGYSVSRKSSWMQVGSSLFSDKNRFSVELPDAEGNPVRRFSLDKDGNTAFYGTVGIIPEKSTQVQPAGAISLLPAKDGKVSNPALGFDKLKSVPKEAAPWQLYLAELKDGTASKQQLRFELFHPDGDGDPALSQWVVGRQQDYGFQSLLCVRADGTVVVRGELEVTGQVIEGPVPLDFNDPRFRKELLTRWSKGLTGASQEVDAFYAVNLDIELNFYEMTEIEGGAQEIDDGAEIDYKATNFEFGKTYGVKITVWNSSRKLTIRLLQIEFMLEYFARNSLERTQIAPPHEPEIVAGDSASTKPVPFQFTRDGQRGNEKARASIIVTAAGLAQNVAKIQKNVDITLNGSAAG